MPVSRIETAYHPAQEVGGDFFQILSLPAAMTVSLLVGALRSLAETTRSPAALLAGLNRRLLGRGASFTTAIALHLTPSGALTFSNAGHLAPFCNGEEIASPPAFPLGLDPDASFAEQTVQLAPGDRLTLMTDGVAEATSARQELFGFARAASLSTEPAQAIAEAARHFGQADDITVLTILLQPATA